MKRIIINPRSTGKTSRARAAIRVLRKAGYTWDNGIWQAPERSFVTLTVRECDIDRIKAEWQHAIAKAPCADMRLQPYQEKYMRKANGLHQIAEPDVQEAPATVAVPDGYKLVPIEPTQEMLDSAIATDRDGSPASYKTLYIVMVGAAKPPAPQAQPADALSQAARDVLAERQRQISAEGWTPAHDDEHDKGEIAVAAALYALRRGCDPSLWITTSSTANGAFLEAIEKWLKPCSPRRALEKSGALILAEMERLDRAAMAAAQEGGAA